MDNGKRGRGRPRIYDWDRWLARKSFVMRPGIDYACLPDSLVQQLRNAASVRGIRIASVVVDELGAVRVRMERAECPG